jgi:hypothetical protein
VLVPPYRVRLYDEGDKVLSGLRCNVSIGTVRYEVTSDGAGWIEVPLGDVCPEIAIIEWEEEHHGRMLTRRIEVMLACHDRNPNAVAMARLHNLGYPVPEDPENSVALFQVDFELPRESLSGGEIPAATRERITQAWEDRLG